MKPTIRWIFDIILSLGASLAGVVTLLFSHAFDRFLLQLAARTFSADGVISSSNMNQLSHMARAASLFLLFTGILVLVFGSRKLWGGLRKVVQLAYSDQALPSNPAGRVRLLLWLPSLLSTAVVAMAAFEGRWGLQDLYGEDRLMENLSFVLLFSAGFLLAAAARQTRNRYLRLYFVLAAALVLILALEEISYGQRIFGWRTPEILWSLNAQHETNIHNLFNSRFDRIYPLLSLVLLPVSLSLYYAVQPQKNPFPEGILPHPSLLWPALLTAFFALTAGFARQELLEMLVTIIVFFHALRVWQLAGYVDHQRA